MNNRASNIRHRWGIPYLRDVALCEFYIEVGESWRALLFRISQIVQRLKLFCQRCVMLVEEENQCERLHF